MQKQQKQEGNQIQSQNQIQSNHSLSADLAMGWRPKLKVIGPIPLNFDNQPIDRSIKQLLKSQASIYNLVYLGPRPLNTFKMHQVLKKNYKYKYQHLFSVQYGHLKAFFHKFYSDFEPKMKHPFIGMNPKFKNHKISFDSCFQSGNLDAVVKITQNQYDLILRIDSNTAGHIMWYYFRVANNQNQQKRIKINIVNLRRNKSCYQRGMKPFIRKRARPQNNNDSPNTNENWTQWQQGGQNVQVDEDRIRFQKQSIVFNNGLAGLAQPPRLFRYLSFQIDLEANQQSQIAYCIPYTYGDLLSDLKSLKQTVTDQKLKNIHLEVDTNNQSLSGLQIPIIKITDKMDSNYDEETQKTKYCAFIIGRQHPGQSNGSFVMRGILNQLIKNTPQMIFLRRHFVFKIIPMLNVDGVVAGNFRTSLYGKDLNRLFKKSQLFLIPEVQICKQEFSKLLLIHKTKVMLFLDIHGHSARRNAFCYGPGILDANAYSDVRQLAKIIATRTQIFRYPSCTFRINQDKQTTARACFSKSVALGYTIQSSNWSYYSRSEARQINFNQKSWQSVGHAVIEGSYFYAYEKIKKKLQKKKKNKGKNEKQKDEVLIDEKMFLNNEMNRKLKNQSPQKQGLKRTQKMNKNFSIQQSKDRRQTSPTKKKYTQNQAQNSEQERNSSHFQKDKSTKKINYKKQKPYQINLIEEQENQSDKMSQDQMDSDSQGQDMQKQKFQKYMNGAKKMMIEFQKVYFGQDYEKKGKMAQRLKNQNKRLMKQTSNKNFKKNTEVLACLRKPIATGNAKINTKLQISPSKLVDIASKITLEPRRGNGKNSIQMRKGVNELNAADQQRNIQENQQTQHIWKTQKAPFIKKNLPRLQPYSQLPQQRKNKGQKISLQEKLARIQEWSHKNQSPQLIQHDDQIPSQYRQNYYQYDNQYEDEKQFRNNNRPKAKTNYQIKKSYNVSPIKRYKPPFQTVQSKDVEQQGYESSNNAQDYEYEFNDSNSSSDSIKYQLESRKQNRENIKRIKKMSELEKQNNLNMTQQFQQNNLQLIKQNYRYHFLSNGTQNQTQSGYLGLLNRQSSNYEKNSNRQQDELTRIVKMQQRQIKQKINKSTRFNMKNSIQRIPDKYQLIKGKNDGNQMDRIALLAKLNDPVSMGYDMNGNMSYHQNHRQIVSSQNLGEGKYSNNKQKLNLQFYQINYSKKPEQNGQLAQNSSKNSPVKNYQKIQQIISNNIKIKDPKPDEKKQFSINAVSIKGVNPQQQLSQRNKKARQTSSKNKLNPYEPQQNQNIQKLFYDKSQLISSSVILPKNNELQALQKLKTLQSQNLIRNDAINQINKSQNVETKQIKISLSANRNHSERKGQKEFDILKEEDRINKKMLKFGGQFLPKISHLQKKSATKRYSQDSHNKIEIKGYKNNDIKQMSQADSIAAKQKKNAIINKNNMLLSNPNTDYKNIKLICISQEKMSTKNKTDSLKFNMFKSTQKNNAQLSHKKSYHHQLVKRNNKQKLLARLKELQNEQRRQFGDHPLLINSQYDLHQKPDRKSQVSKKNHKLVGSHLEFQGGKDNKIMYSDHNIENNKSQHKSNHMITQKSSNFRNDTNQDHKDDNSNISKLSKKQLTDPNSDQNIQNTKNNVQTNFYFPNQEYNKYSNVIESVFGLPTRSTKFSGLPNGNQAK